jgi:hypothetical protein
MNFIFVYFYINLMFEQLKLVVSLMLRFAVTYLISEIAWHFTAYRIGYDVRIKSCLFKQVKATVVSSRAYKGRKFT